MVPQNLLLELDAVRSEVTAIGCRLEQLERRVNEDNSKTVPSIPQRNVSRTLPTSIRHRFDEAKQPDYSTDKNCPENEPVNKDGAYRTVFRVPQVTSSQNTTDDSSPSDGEQENSAKNRYYSQYHSHAGASTNAANSPDMEVQIGTVWLNRIGIGSLVLGVVFLILYSFQYFGVAAKLLLGYLVSTALIFGGEKISKQEGRDWYGNALIGGGWSLMYFTAYAMHFIPALKVIHSLAAELFILCGIAASAMRHAVYKKSEPLAMIATLLGVASIAFGHPSHLSYIGYMAITAGAALIAVSQKWMRVFYVALITCYSAHFCTSVALSFTEGGRLALVDSAWAFSSLFSSWLVFSAATYLFARREPKNQENFIVITWLNVIYLTGSIFLFGQGAMSGSIYLLLAAASACYMVSAGIMRKQNLILLADTHSLFGLLNLTTALGTKFTGEARLTALLAEAIAISFVHLRNRNQIYGWFAPALILIVFIQWILRCNDCTHRLTDTNLWMGLTSPILCLIGIMAATASGALAWVYRGSEQSRAKSDKSGNLTNLALHSAYLILANIFGLAIPVLIGLVDVRAFYWCFLTCVNAALYHRNGNPIFQVFSNIALSATVMTTIFFSWMEVTTSSYVLTGMMFCLDWASSTISEKYKSSLRFFGQAAIILTLTLVFQLPSQTISIGLGILGLASLIVGFIAQIKIYRTWGLFSLGLLSCRLVFVDLAHENTIERIIAFTVSGAVLLLGSYAYAKFAELRTAKTSTPSGG